MVHWGKPRDDWQAVWSEVRGELLVFGLLSVGASLVLCGLYWGLPRVRRMPGWIMMRATICELLASVGFLLLYFDGFRESRAFCHGEVHTGRFALLLCIVAMEVSAYAWRLVSFFHLVFIYLNPFNPERHRHWYPLFVCTLALATAGGCALKLAAVSPNNGDDCASEYFGLISVGLFIVPFSCFVVVGGALDVTVRVLGFSASKEAQRTGHHASISFLARQRVMRHSSAYLLLYGTQLGAGLVVLGFLRFGPEHLYLFLWRALVILACGRPALSLLGWLIINDIVYIVFGVCSFFKPWHTVRPRWRRPLPSREDLPSEASAEATTLPGGSSGVPGSSGVAVDLVGVLAGQAASSSQPRIIIRTPSQAEREFRDRPTSLLPSEIQERIAGVTEAMATRATTVQGIEEVGFKEELRFELLYDVALGIGELAQRELQESPAAALNPSASAPSLTFGILNRAREALSPRTSDTSGSTVAADPAASGSRTVPAATQRAMGRLLLPRLPLSRSHSDGHEPLSSRGAKPLKSRTRHYGVEQFRAVRAAFGISPVAYAKAFPDDLSETDPSWRQRLKESVSEGASGSFFYRVLCREDSGGLSSCYIIKQITWREKNTLMRFLPAYTEHVVRRGGRSLVQYFGCHSMSLRWRFSGRVYFVVMRNFLPVRQWLTFDIKGATANRRALAADMLHQIHAGEDPRAGATWGTLRDWEWMDIAMVCDLSSADKAELAAIIAADAEFLCTQGLLDYSLLVGIHRMPDKAFPSAKEAYLQQMRDAGGYISVDRQRVYFFGIIDVLEHYSLRWRVQHAVLNGAYCLACKCAAAEGISAMPPHDYADRFRTFVLREILQVEGTTSAPPMSGAGNRWWRQARSCFRRCSGMPAGDAPGGDLQLCQWPPAWGGGRGTLRSAARWSPLWERRRRGLVRERIEVERADHLRRIAELEAQLTTLRPN